MESLAQSVRDPCGHGGARVWTERGGKALVYRDASTNDYGRKGGSEMSKQGYLNETAKFAEKDAKLMDEMAEELRSLNWEIEACGRDGKIEYEKACQLAKKVIKAAANYL